MIQTLLQSEDKTFYKIKPSVDLTDFLGILKRLFA